MAFKYNDHRDKMNEIYDEYEIKYGVDRDISNEEFEKLPEEEKEEFDIKLPNVGEYSKELMLSFEKEVLGIYVSGHPLEEYEALWKKHITNKTSDFVWDEEIMGKWFYQRPSDPDLIILRSWVEGK